jgi:hypothetical protein
MYREFGRGPLECEGCKNLVTRKMPGMRSQSYCTVYGFQVGVPEHVFQARWHGCGHYNRPLQDGKQTVLEMYKETDLHAGDPEEQLTMDSVKTVKAIKAFRTELAGIVAAEEHLI